MKTVKQLDPGGCGIAAVAAVCGKTYEEVRAVYLAMPGAKEERILAAGAGLTHLVLEDLLEALGMKDRAEVRMTVRPIIRLTTKPHGGPGHWVVIDGHGKVHDSLT